MCGGFPHGEVLERNWEMHHNGVDPGQRDPLEHHCLGHEEYCCSLGKIEYQLQGLTHLRQTSPLLGPFLASHRVPFASPLPSAECRPLLIRSIYPSSKRAVCESW